MLLVSQLISQEYVNNIMASHQLANFGGHKHCDSEDVMILGCHMISQDHVIKG